MQKSFVLNLNKCTGCQACQIACAIENRLDPHMSWRQIHTFNEHHYPDIPLFHLSLACHHCGEPDCMKYCPALAYSKDAETGAVTIAPELCIGCKYCSWACPYDAPQFNHFSGVMEKCTLCNQRLKEGKEPACVALCPTAALQLREYEDGQGVDSVPGFTKTDIKPAMQFIPLRDNMQAPECTAPAPVDFKAGILTGVNNRITHKISLLSEWNLIIFTFLSTLLVGQISATLLSTVKFNPFIFILTGMLAMILSAFHLGKKVRAYRSILNWRRSWLSREIILYSTFLGLSTVYLFFTPQNRFIGWTVVLTGFLTLLAIDQVYLVTRTRSLHSHSAQVILTGLLFVGIFSDYSWLVIGVAVLKLFLYSYRKFIFMKNKQEIRPFVSVVRILFGFLIPLFIWLLILENLYFYAVISAVLGEIIDRSEYYLEIDIPTPRKQMKTDLKIMLQKL